MKITTERFFNCESESNCFYAMYQNWQKIASFMFVFFWIASVSCENMSFNVIFREDINIGRLFL